MTNYLLLKEFLLDNYVIINFVIALVLVALICLTILIKKHLNYVYECKKISIVKECVKDLIPNFVFSVIIVAVFAFAIGYRYYIVTSGSMRPSIEPGAVVLIKKVPFEDLKVGDTITFSYDGTSNVTHQIIAIKSEGFQLGEEITYQFKGEEYTFAIESGGVGKTIITHGTANSINAVDSPISYSNIRGRVYYCIWYVGLIVYTIRKYMIAVVIVIFAIYFGYRCYLKNPKYNLDD